MTPNALESKWQWASPAVLARECWQRRHLIRQFAERDVVGRYKGSYLGVVWSFLYPLLTLTVYTFVFGAILKSRWDVSLTGSRAEFALNLFCGQLLFAIFAEAVNRAPRLVVDNPNFVKKVVFPLEILPVAAVGAALTHAAISVIILLGGQFLVMHQLQWTVLWLPVLVVPLVFLTLGVSWLLASLGVFIRDIGYVTGIGTHLMMFLTPMFYPISAVPEAYRWIIQINPMSTLLESGRRVVLWGQSPQWLPLLVVTLVAALIMQLGYFFFMRSKRAFADVI